MSDLTERVARALSYTSLAMHPNPGPQRDAMVNEAAAVAVEAVEAGAKELLVSDYDEEA